jgi:hypothetical protein
VEHDPGDGFLAAADRDGHRQRGVGQLGVVMLGVVATWIDEYNRDRWHASFGMIPAIDYAEALCAQASPDPGYTP